MSGSSRVKQGFPVMNKNKEKLLKVLLSPHISEKSSGQYIFRVIKNANKRDVKKAIQHIFQVKVKAVNIVNVKGEMMVRFGRPKSRRSSWKKAYVTLHAGEQINIGA